MRVPKTWLITDTHFKHEKLHFEGWRPKDFEARIKRHWLSMVMTEDTVIHLGDVTVGGDNELLDLLTALPGTKILVRGNHDHRSDGWYMRNGFAYVAHGILRSKIWLTHAPQFTLPDGALLNVHGHLHDRVDNRGLTLYPWNKLLALEFTDYKPVEFDKFVATAPVEECQGCKYHEAGHFGNCDKVLPLPFTVPA